MKALTTKKIYPGYYKVNEIKQETIVAKSIDEDNLWYVSCPDLNVLSKWDSKKECLQYLYSVIFECDNYIGYSLNTK